MTRRLDPNNTDAADRAGALIRAGELVVIPTETVYGLAAAADDPVAVAAIFHAKGRPQDNPLIVHLGSVTDALAVIPSHLRAARAVVQAFAPGPLTVVVPAPQWVAPAVSAGLDTVAIRVPDHATAREVISAAGVPVAAPSANRSGRPSPTSFEMAWAEMDGRVAAIIDGGECAIGIESTVVDATDPSALRILRPGAVSAEAIQRRLGLPVLTVTSSDSGESESNSAAERTLHRSPGTRYRHYQPSVPIVAFGSRHALDDLFERARPGERIRVICGPAHGEGRLVGGDGRNEDARSAGFARDEAGLSGTRDVRIMPSWTSYARSLYREFWLAERDGIDRLYVELPDHDVEEGLHDRISRAASESFSL